MAPAKTQLDAVATLAAEDGEDVASFPDGSLNSVAESSSDGSLISVAEDDDEKEELSPDGSLT